MAVISTPSSLINEIEVAEILDIKVTTLRRWRWAGKPPSFVKLGSAVRYERKTIQQLIDNGRRNSTTDTGSE